MKALFPSLLMVLLFAYPSFGQSYSEDFESFADNDKIAVVSPARWVTWSNTPGSAEDAPVVSERANSGSKSLKLFNTNPAGGPMDVVLRFGQKYSTGNFSYEMYMFVEEGKAAYFNFQRENSIGTAWAMDANFNKDGSMVIATGAVRHYLGSYPTATWFKIRFDINLDKNMWKLSIDDECRVVFRNTTNALASINLYPTGDGGSSYYIDDVQFEYNAVSPTITKDVGVSQLAWNAGKIVGSKDLVTYAIRNNGTETIQDVSLTLFHNGREYLYDFEGIEIFPGASFDFEAEDLITLEEGLNTISVYFSNIDGGTEDDEVCNNQLTFEIQAVKPAPHKAVLAEEGTGTWCVWCPRGAVYMDLLNDWYEGLFIPIAVHNNDPMTVPVYDQLVRATPGFTGFPGAIINRKTVMDPSAMENPFLNEIVKETKVAITPGARWDENQRMLDISAELEALQDLNGEYWISAVLTEDNVRGTGAGWSQANAYAGGGNGPMGGYESLPNPVPANLMRYDHVARAIAGPAKSPANTFAADYTAGERHIANFSIPVPTTVNIDNTHITIIVFGPTGYENAHFVPFSKALENGYLTHTDQTVTADEVVTLFPNPASQESYVRLNPTTPESVRIRVTDLHGKTLMQRDYGVITGEHIFPIPTQGLSHGVYLIQIAVGDTFQTQKLQVK